MMIGICMWVYQQYIPLVHCGCSFSWHHLLLNASHAPMQVHFNPDVTGPRHLIQAVEDAGFDAQLADTDRYR